MIAVMAAIIQLGIVFWAQNTLTQVVRDTGRWEATQGSCSNSAAVVSQAKAIAGVSSLIGYNASSWSSANVTVTFSPTVADVSDACPPYPTNNGQFSWVKITITHSVPTFFPGMEYLPALGTCDPNCHITLSSTAQFRLEPKP